MGNFRPIDLVDMEHAEDALKGLPAHEGWPHLKRMVSDRLERQRDITIKQATSCEQHMLVAAGRCEGLDDVLMIFQEIEKKLADSRAA
jgi:hypothetical protein